MLQEYLRRIGLLLVGLLVSAIGITLMLQANIGLEPWSVLQQGIAKTFGITYGTAASIVGAAVIAIAYFCGESFGLGTLANIFVCPIFIDILLYLNWVPLFERFSTGLAALLIGMELLALGTWMYMKSTLGSGPRDALMVVLARKTHRTVGLCRAAVEVVIVWIGWQLGGQVGIGTIVAAVGVGSLFNLNFALLRLTLPCSIRRICRRPFSGSVGGKPSPECPVKITCGDKHTEWSYTLNKPGVPCR